VICSGLSHILEHGPRRFRILQENRSDPDYVKFFNLCGELRGITMTDAQTRAVIDPDASGSSSHGAYFAFGSK
jgi:hypothetical protein